MIYKPRYFKLYELVPKEFYELYKDNPYAYYIFDPRILVTADRLRKRYGKKTSKFYENKFDI